MAEWESSYAGRRLRNARILTSEEIQKRYPPENNSSIAKLTRELVEKGYDILYGEHPNPDISINKILGYNWGRDVRATAAYLYNTNPTDIEFGGYTDMSQLNLKAIFVAVKLREYLDNIMVFG